MRLSGSVLSCAAFFTCISQAHDKSLTYLLTSNCTAHRCSSAAAAPSLQVLELHGLPEEEQAQAAVWWPEWRGASASSYSGAVSGGDAFRLSTLPL